MDKEEKFFLYCTCGCSVLVMNFYDWESNVFEDIEDEILWITYLTSFNKATIREKLKAIWLIIRGRDRHMYDIGITRSQLKEFKAYIDRCSKSLKREI